MDNYTINRTFGFVRLPFQLMSDSGDPFKELNKQRLIDERISKDVSEIQDYEITTFSPQGRDTLTYDIFFNMYLMSSGMGAMKKLLSTPFTTYFNQMAAHFDLLKGDKIVFPTFWNSLCYPYYPKRNTWYSNKALDIVNPKRFDSKSYMYNSFLKMNFYTTPYAATQELLFQQVIYMNPRWCKDYEGDANGKWHRPKFTLDETTDGYYLYWINNYDISTFYVNYQFWDAANGRLINLMPTSDSSKHKQWVQPHSDPDFDMRNMYAEYKLSYSNKTYNVGEFDYTTNAWSIYGADPKLYEVVFDREGENYAAQNPYIYVENVEPSIVIPPTITGDFGIYMPTWICKLTPDTPDDITDITVELGTEPSFYQIRGDLYGATVDNAFYAYNTDRNPANKITVTNNGGVPFYLKDIQIELVSDKGSTNYSIQEPRMTGMRKTSTSTSSQYTLYSVPTPSIVFDYTGSNGEQLFGKLQRRFQESTIYNVNNITNGFTVADEQDAGQPSYWNSVRFMKFSYPITATNFPAVASDFSEQLNIQHSGTKLSPINPNETLSLNLSWGCGRHYSTVYLEPLYYDICEQNYNIFPSPTYKINLNYKVTLFFNNLAGTLPEGANKRYFTVPVTHSIVYKNKSGSGGVGERFHPTVQGVGGG